jgi:hypothetical protein
LFYELKPARVNGKQGSNRNSLLLQIIGGPGCVGGVGWRQPLMAICPEPCRIHPVQAHLRILTIPTLVGMEVKYEHAEGLPRDYLMAVTLNYRAARLGNADAQYALGWMYANGRGASKDDGVASTVMRDGGRAGA